MKEAVIKIVDRHIADGEESIYELTSSGSFEKTEGGCKVVYSETDEEMADCVTTLTVEGSEKIIMSRVGKYSTEMTIEKERRHSCFYSTPFGALMMGVYATEIANEVGESGGTLRFSYTIDFNNAPASENRLCITVAEKAASVGGGNTQEE